MDKEFLPWQEQRILGLLPWLLYLAAVLDLKNKEVIGYEVSKNIDTELCKRELANALAQRGRHKGLVFYSDRGSQYSSRSYKSMLAENGIEGSMSAPGCPYDNSCEELFFALLKSVFCCAQKRNDPIARKVLQLRRKYATIEDIKTDLYRYATNWDSPPSTSKTWWMTSWIEFQFQDFFAANHI